MTRRHRLLGVAGIVLISAGALLPVASNIWRSYHASPARLNEVHHQDEPLWVQLTSALLLVAGGAALIGLVVLERRAPDA